MRYTPTFAAKALADGVKSALSMAPFDFAVGI